MADTRTERRGVEERTVGRLVEEGSVGRAKVCTVGTGMGVGVAVEEVRGNFGFSSFL